MRSKTAIDVRWTAIERARNRAHPDDLWLLLRTSSGSLHDLNVATREADSDANTEGLLAEHENPIYTGPLPAATPDGFVVELRANDWPVQNRWLTHFADRLTARGFAGTLVPAPEAVEPRWLSQTTERQLTAFVSWRLDMPLAAADPDGLTRWYVPTGTTERIARFADRWARIPDSQLVLALGMYYLALDTDDASDLLARAPFQTGMAKIEFYSRHEQIGTEVAFDPIGLTTFQEFRGNPGAVAWPDRLDRARAALLALPADLTHGYIRSTAVTPGGYGPMEMAYPLDNLSTDFLDRAPHLHHRYLPDAHGVQVVTTTHLDHAHDLSNWTITNLGHDRHLVEAADLEPWYAGPIPDRDVLSQARADFAGALLTDDIYRAAAPESPWKRR